MGYKIYYRELWEVQDKAIKQCESIIKKIEELTKIKDEIVSTDSMKGAAADAFKTYMEEIHGKISSLFLLVISDYSCLITQYGREYFENIDEKNHKVNNTILSGEITGTVPKRISSIDGKLDTIIETIKTAVNSVSDLKSFKKPSAASFDQSITDTGKTAKDLDNRIMTFESGKDDLANIHGILTQISSIIDYQTGKNRVTPNAYVPGSVAAMVDIDELNKCVAAADAEMTTIKDSDWYEDAVIFAINREAAIAELEREDREWVKYVEIGVAVVGTVVFTVATAGAGSVAAAAVIGAAIGGTTAATNSFLDNYYENGSLVEGMDWKEFSKTVLTGAAVGGVGGAFSFANGVGTVLKSPMEAVVASVSKGALENAAEGLIDTTVDVFCDVGEGIVKGKSPEDIISVTAENAEQNIKDMMEDMLTDMPKDAVSGYLGNVIDTKINIKSNYKPNFFQRYSKELLSSEAGTAVEHAASGTIKSIGACVDGDKNTTVKSVLIEEGQGFLEDSGKNLFDSGIKAINNPKSALGSTVKAVTVDGIANATGDNVIEQVVDSSLKGDVSVSLDKMKQDLIIDDGAQEYAKSVGSGIGNTIHSEYVKSNNEEMQDSLSRRYDADNDGKVEFVSFGGDYGSGITKADYEAAKKLAGTGAYKDQTVQQILGLPRNVDVDNVYYSKHTIDDSYIRENSRNDDPVSKVKFYDFSHHKK